MKIRRQFKRGTKIIGLFLAAGMICGLLGCDSDDDDKTVAKKKNVILMIADGSQLEHERAYSRFVSGDDVSNIGQSFPYKGWNTSWDVTTYDMWAWNASRQGIDIDNENYTNDQWIMEPG